MRKIIFLAVIFFSVLLLIPPMSLAAKKRSRKVSQVFSYVPKGVQSRVKFRADRLGVLINFSNFDNLESGSYELVYDSNGVTQAAGGSIILGDTSTKEILFATCSGGVCHFHDNITNARLSITSRLKDGSTVLKPYRLKV